MRQPPENSAQGRCWSAVEKPRPDEDRGRARRRRMRADVGEPRLDLGDAVRVVRGLGLGQQRAALDVGLEHDLEQAFRAVRRFLRQPADAPARRQLDAAVLGRDVAGDHVEQRGLAGAVAADKADAGAGRDAGGGAFEQRAAGNADGEIVDDEHARLLAEQALQWQPLSNLPRQRGPGYKPRQRVSQSMSTNASNQTQRRILPMAVERTFSILKPDATARNLTGAINAMIEQAGLRIIAQKRVHIRARRPRSSTPCTSARPFFGELVEFMISGPVVVQVLEGEGAIAKYRDVMGATDPAKAAPNTIRKVHAKSIGENSVHGSDAARHRDARDRAVLRGERNRRLMRAATDRRHQRVVVDTWIVCSERRAQHRPAILARGPQDHLDQYPAVRRQRRGHRAGLPRLAAARAVVGHDHRRRRRRRAAIVFTGVVAVADDAALSEARRRRSRCSGSRSSCWCRRRTIRRDTPEAVEDLWRAVRIVADRRHRHEPRQRDRGRRASPRANIALLVSRACRQHPDGDRRQRASSWRCSSVSRPGLGRRRDSRLDCRRHFRQRPGRAGLVRRLFAGTRRSWPRRSWARSLRRWRPAMSGGAGITSACEADVSGRREVGRRYERDRSGQARRCQADRLFRLPARLPVDLRARSRAASTSAPSAACTARRTTTTPPA